MKIIPLVSLGLMLSTALTEAAVSCSMSSEGLNFGIINPLSSAEITSIATVNLDCIGGPISYIVQLSQGNGTMAQRVMKSGSDNLKYNLYTSNSYSNVLGDGTGGSATITGSSVTDTMKASHYIHGKVSTIGLINTLAGVYSDNILMTIIY
jgi:spore coat protein U-like protein